MEGKGRGLEPSKVQNAESGWGGAGPKPPGRNPSVFVFSSSSRPWTGTINKTIHSFTPGDLCQLLCIQGADRKGKKAKGVKETKKRFPNFPFLFSPLSLSTLKGLSEAGVGAARGRSCHWLPGSGDLHIGCYKSRGGAQRRSSSREKEGGLYSVGRSARPQSPPEPRAAAHRSPAHGSQRACS